MKKELINVTSQNGELLVSARDLYEGLGGKERFSKWFERMVSYGFEEGIDYTPYQMVHPKNKQEMIDYALKIDTAKEICMLQKSEKGREFRKYFIECEKQLREVNIQPKFELPQNYLEALKALVQSEEEKIVLIEENNQLKDEVEDLKEYKLFKSMINNRTEDSMLLGQFGQLLKSNCPNLKTGRNLIFKYCKENNLVKVEYKENYATFYAVNNGWLMNVSDIVDGRGGTTLCNKIYITNKGCLYLGKKLFEDYLKSNI